MADTVELDPKQVSLKKLDDIKIERVQHILKVVVKLCKEAKRKDGDGIIDALGEDLEQLLLIGQEIGRREATHDKPARKLS